MALPTPNLDDRTYDQLVAEAIDIVRRGCPEWSDLSPGDPGVILMQRRGRRLLGAHGRPGPLPTVDAGTSSAKAAP
jgi:hypothetical protein